MHRTLYAIKTEEGYLPDYDISCKHGVVGITSKWSWREPTMESLPRLFSNKQSANRALGQYLRGAMAIDKDSGIVKAVADLDRKKSDYQVIEFVLSDEII